MHKILVLYPEPTDRKAFDEHYRSTHLPLVRRLPGARDLRYSLGIEDGPYYAVFEAVFESTDAFQAAMSSDAGQTVAADVPNYATGGATVLNYPVTEA